MNLGEQSEFEFDEVVVRPLQSSDANHLRFVRMQALADSPNAYAETLADARASDWQARTHRLSRTESGDRVAYLAFVGPLPVGMIIAGYGEPNQPPFLAAMWVHPDFRRHGLGRALVSSGLGYLREAGRASVSLWVTEPHFGVFAFYEALGFRRTGVRAPLRPGSDQTILELSFDLSESAR